MANKQVAAPAVGGDVRTGASDGKSVDNALLDWSASKWGLTPLLVERLQLAALLARVMAVSEATE